MFQAYHSSFTDNEAALGNMALLPLKTNYRGPAPSFAGKDMDIIDEALYFFKANVFFRTYEIKVQCIYFFTNIFKVCCFFKYNIFLIPLF